METLFVTSHHDLSQTPATRRRRTAIPNGKTQPTPPTETGLATFAVTEAGTDVEEGTFVDFVVVAEAGEIESTEVPDDSAFVTETSFLGGNEEL